MRSPFSISSLALLTACLLACGSSESPGGGGAGGGGAAGHGGGTSSGLGGGGASSGTGGSAPGCSGGSYDACTPCCEALHPGGGAAFAERLQQCACGFGMCQFKCGAICSGGAVDAACMENIAWDYNSPGFAGPAGGGSFGACAQDATCAGFAACLTTCAVGRGPIAAPPAGATPPELCVHYINAYRAWESKAPLARWTENEACVDGQAANDNTAGPHAAFGQCGESAQNECLGFAPEQVGACMAMMYGEKFSGDQGMAHYLTMTGGYTKVACGFSTGSTAAQDYK